MLQASFNIPLQGTTITCYGPFYKILGGEVATPSLSAYICCHVVRMDNHKTPIWIQGCGLNISCVGNFLDVTMATLEAMVGNMTLESHIIRVLKTTLIINCFCFLFIINPLFFCSAFYQQCNKTSPTRLQHVSSNQPISCEIFLWMNKELLLDLHGNFLWLHLYLALHKESFDYLPPTFRFLTITQISHTSKMFCIFVYHSFHFTFHPCIHVLVI